MLTKEELNDLYPIINVQYNLLNKITQKIEEIDRAFSINEDIKLDIIIVQTMLNDILQDIDLLSQDDILYAQEEAEGICSIYEKQQQQIKASIEQIKFTTWDKYVEECYKYSFRENIDPFIPYEIFLSKSDLEIINNEKYNKRFKWDKWDYIFVGLAGIIGVLTDIFIVSIPRDMTSGVYKGQKGSCLTKWLQDLKLPEGLQKMFEKISKVPYDNTGGSTHRVDTFGHDPILGLVFGVIDIIKGTSTSIKNGNIVIEKIGGGEDPLEAIIKQFIHLCSDICTKRGLPIPFASVFKLLNVGSFERGNGKKATISELATWMYYHGYDLRHFATMSTTSATIELILRLYIMIRHYVENDEIAFKVGGDPKYRSMLLTSHAIACAGNVGKIYLKQGNLLAINYAEWLMLIRYIVPSVKYWLFDKSNLEIKHIESINDDIWDELLENSDKLLIKSKFENIEPFIL